MRRCAVARHAKGRHCRPFVLAAHPPFLVARYVESPDAHRIDA